MTEMRTPTGGIATSFSDGRAPGEASTRRFMTLKRAAMAGVTAFIAVNIWTGAPLLALWVGSQFVDHGTLSMAAVGVVVVVLAVLVFTLALALTLTPLRVARRAPANAVVGGFTSQRARGRAASSVLDLRRVSAAAFCPTT